MGPPHGNYVSLAGGEGIVYLSWSIFLRDSMGRGKYLFSDLEEQSKCITRVEG